MLTEDYIMRMINQALAVLLKLAGFKQSGRHGEALQLIDKALEGLLGMRADLVKRLDDESLRDLLRSQDELDTDRLLVVADLFKEEGDILAEQNRHEETLLSRLRALNFYLEVELSGGPENLPAPHDKIEYLLDLLEGREYPVETAYSLLAYFELRGRFRDAERMLEALGDAPGVGEEILEEKADFYRRLLERSDSELTAAGMNRSEIEAKLSDNTP